MFNLNVKKSKYNNAKPSIQAHPSFVNDTHPNYDLQNQ